MKLLVNTAVIIMLMPFVLIGFVGTLVMVALIVGYHIALNFSDWMFGNYEELL